jgi:hypothetical protein
MSCGRDALPNNSQHYEVGKIREEGHDPQQYMSLTINASKV